MGSNPTLLLADEALQHRKTDLTPVRVFTPWRAVAVPLIVVPQSNQAMSNNNIAVAIYGTHAEAETAIKELQQSGFDMRKLSIAGRDYHTDEHVVGYYNMGDRMKSWGKTGAFWGGIWGWLFGSAFFFLPGFGPLLFAGPIVGWMTAALEGAVLVGGMSALGGALVSIGIPKDSVLEYETAL